MSAGTPWWAKAQPDESSLAAPPQCSTSTSTSTSTRGFRGRPSAHAGGHGGRVRPGQRWKRRRRSGHRRQRPRSAQQRHHPPALPAGTRLADAHRHAAPACLGVPAPERSAGGDRQRPGAGKTPVLAQVLSGPGGVGKSQLAAAYVHEAVLDGTELVLWVPAADVQQVVSLYAQAAVLVQAPGALGEDSEQDARAFLGWLAATSRTWLVVLDDVADPGAVAPWWPPGRPGIGRVLATSRLKDVRLTGQGRARIDIGVFSGTEAAAYLEQRLGAEGVGHLLDGSAQELAEDLGHLPLAIGHAAAYLINEQLSGGAYLRRLRDRTRGLDELLPVWADTEGYGRHVGAALLLSLDAATTASPDGLVRLVLELAALLDPAGHPEALWSAPAVLDHLARHRQPAASAESTPTPDEVRSALLVLHRYALINYSAHREHLHVGIHSLTARAVREAGPAPGSEPASSAVSAAADGLLSIWPDPDQREHALAAVLRANTATLARTDASEPWRDNTRALVFRAGRSLLDNGLTHAARVYWQEVVPQAEESLGADHSDTLTALAELARTYRVLGTYEEALRLSERVLASRERFLGGDHPDTLRAQAEVGSSFRQLGRYEEARRLDEHVLAVRERLLGGDHLDTHEARGNLASSYRMLGRPQDAHRLNQLVADAQQRLLGGDHPKTLGTLLHVASTHGALGQYEEAFRIRQQVLIARAQLLGPDHPDTLNAQSNLVVSYAELGRHEEARELGLHVVAQRQRLLGEHHPETLRARANLAHVYRELGLHGDALLLAEQVLAEREQLLGTDHPDALLSRLDLSQIYEALGRYHDALHVAEALLADCERILGPKHPYTLIAHAGVAQHHGQLGHYDIALSLGEQAMSESERVLGPDHPTTLTVRGSLATVYAKMERREEALGLITTVAAALERTLGPEHPHTLQSRLSLAALYDRTDRNEDALRLHQQSVTDAERLRGRDHPDTLSARGNLAQHYCAVGRYEEAISLGERVLSDRERIFGPDHPATGLARNNLAYSYQAVGRHEDALPSSRRRSPSANRPWGPSTPTPSTPEEDSLSFTSISAEPRKASACWNLWLQTASVSSAPTTL